MIIQGLEYWNKLLNRFEPQQSASEILETYLTIHEKKLGMHWIYAAAFRLAGGESEADVMRDFGYFRTVIRGANNGK